MTPKVPPKITATYLENAALHYLERFDSSAANLRRVLMRKVDRSLAHWGGERDEVVPLVDALIERCIAQGWIDDAGYAERKAAGLRRQGRSTRVIRGTLAAKGIAAELVDPLIGGPEEDLQAARELARRRKLGLSAERRMRDLAVLGRAGFDYDTARRVIDALLRPENQD